MKQIRLLLSEHFGNKIFTRNIISNFFHELSKLKEDLIVFDFKDIDFISRSCADEYLKLKEKFPKKLVEENMSNAVCSMFKLVEMQHESSGITYSVDTSIKNNCSILPN